MLLYANTEYFTPVRQFYNEYEFIVWVENSVYNVLIRKNIWFFKGYACSVLITIRYAGINRKMPTNCKNVGNFHFTFFKVMQK